MITQDYDPNQPHYLCLPLGTTPTVAGEYFFSLFNSSPTMTRNTEGYTFVGPIPRGTVKFYEPNTKILIGGVVGILPYIPAPFDMSLSKRKRRK